MARGRNSRRQTGRPSKDDRFPNIGWPALAHLVVILVIPPTYYLLRETSPGDPIVSAVKLALGVGAFFWGTMLFLAAAFDSRDRLIERIKAAFRRALATRWLVTTSLMLCVAAEVLLLYDLLAFRTVRVPTRAAIDILVNDRPGEVNHIGSLEAGACETIAPGKVRIPVGKHILVFRSRKSGEPLGFAEVAVPLPWNGEVPKIPCVEGDRENDTLR